MRSHRAFAWTPGLLHRVVLMLVCLLVSTAIAYVHYRSGLAYEFHVFFLLPVGVAPWYMGLAQGLFVALCAIGQWLATDWLLGGEQGSHRPLLFNGAVRLIVFAGVVWLLVQLRATLQREAALARRDPLTGLSNRRMFYEQGRMAIARSRRFAEPFTAMFIDLDNFKQVNDELGHKTGDELLQTVAKVLQHHTRDSDIVGRLGGDEFALLLPGMSGESARAGAQKMRQRLLDTMAEYGWPVTFSIGIATFSSPPDDVDTLVRRADVLMYEVKRSGKNTILHKILSSVPGG